MISLGQIKEVNGYPLKENWYGSMAILSDEQEREALLVSWNAADRNRGTGCGRCHGRGATRADQNVGCHVCLGTGVINE